MLYGKSQLIELLVVIAIIALLLAVVMPVLQAAKRQAQAVICRANIKQWATCYALYTEENDQFFPPFIGGTHEVSYMESLREYYDDINKMRTCPTAIKVFTDNPTGIELLSFFGSTFGAWQIDPTAVWLPDDDWGIGSYGENSWIRSGSGAIEGKSWEKISSAKYLSNVALIGDGKWNNAWPDDTDAIPIVKQDDDKNTEYDIGNWSTIDNYVMRRHRQGLNMAFADMSARRLDAAGLWMLKWNRQYETRSDIDLSALR